MAGRPADGSSSERCQIRCRSPSYMAPKTRGYTSPMARPEAVNALAHLSIALLEDVELARRLLAVVPPGYNRRQFVRAVFALFDGTIYGMKQSACEGATGFSVTWSPSELAMIREEAYDLDDRGNSKIRPLYPRWENNVRFAFGIVARAHKISYPVNFGTNGWNA